MHNTDVNKMHCTNQVIEGKGLVLSERAHGQLQKAAAGEKPHLRLSLLGGGCAGFQYILLFEKVAAQDDLIFEQDGVQVFMESSAYELLQGSEIDYVEELIGSTFVIKNPNATGSCGCGSSFSVF